MTSWGHGIGCVAALVITACTSTVNDDGGAGGMASNTSGQATTVSKSASTSASTGMHCQDALDCYCEGGELVPNACGRFDCVCPTPCIDNDGCASEEVCIRTHGCDQIGGYCAPPEKWPCAGSEAVCGCDQQRYANDCTAFAAGQALSYASPTDCAANPVPCGDPAGTSCYAETQWCEMLLGDMSCQDLENAAVQGCDEYTCDCVLTAYGDCTCSELPGGTLLVTCP